jgi:N-acetyl-anhydromuramyl-L-alanine amidase AmpD
VFEQWHRKRGWDELGYHFVITNGDGGTDGNVEVGSRWLKQKHGAHAKSVTGEYNEQGIGICLVGNFEAAEPTPAQWASLVKLTAFLTRRYDIPNERIIGHQDVNAKTQCPGKGLDLRRLREDALAIP